MKGPRYTSIPAHKPFKSLPPSVLLFPKCNYRPGEGAHCGPGSLQNTASRHQPSLGSKGEAVPPKHRCTSLLRRLWHPPSCTRLTRCFQHHWPFHFSPRRTELVSLIKSKKKKKRYISTKFPRTVQRSCVDSLSFAGDMDDQADRPIRIKADERSRACQAAAPGVARLRQEGAIGKQPWLLRHVFQEMLGHLPVTPPAVSPRHRALIDREGKQLLAGALILSFASGRNTSQSGKVIGFCYCPSATN